MVEYMTQSEGQLFAKGTKVMFKPPSGLLGEVIEVSGDGGVKLLLPDGSHYWTDPDKLIVIP